MQNRRVGRVFEAHLVWKSRWKSSRWASKTRPTLLPTAGSHTPRIRSRLINHGRGLGYPADFAASQLNLQPVVSRVEQPGFDTAVEGRVVASRIVEAIANAEQDAVLADYGSGPSAALFIA